jgi:hypothetical protein
MSKKKTPTIGAKDQAFFDDIDRHISAGISSQIIAKKFHLPLNSTEKLIADRTEIIKNSAGNQRVILRQIFRDSIPKAVSKLNSFIDAKSVDDYELAMVQMKAATELLKHASKFINEDALTAWIERPTFVEQKQKVLQYSAQIDDPGAVTLSADTIDL